MHGTCDAQCSACLCALGVGIVMRMHIAHSSSRSVFAHTHTQSRRQHCANALMPSDVGESFLAWFKSIFNCIRSVTSIACDIRALLVHSCVRNGFAWQIRRFIRDKPGRRINRISLYSIELFLHVDITQCFIEHKMANVCDFHSVKMIQMNRRSAWPHRRPLLFV